MKKGLNFEMKTRTLGNSDLVVSTIGLGLIYNVLKLQYVD